MLLLSIHKVKLCPSKLHLSRFLACLTNPTDDDEHGKTDGCLARTNTVTTCGRAEAAREGLDVAACFSRLQGELKRDEELEMEEAEAEEVDRQEVEEERRRTTDKMWVEKQKRIRAVESTSSIDSRLQEFLPDSEVVSSIFGGPGESSAGPVLWGGLPTDVGPDSASSSGEEGLVIESSVPESVCEPTAPLKFEWGTGIAPGEERYSSKTQSTFGCCVVS